MRHQMGRPRDTCASSNARRETRGRGYRATLVRRDTPACPSAPNKDVEFGGIPPLAHKRVRSVGLDAACLRVVLEVLVQVRVDPRFDIAVVDWADNLHTVHEVARHEVRRRGAHLHIAVGAEAVDAAMLQGLSDTTAIANNEDDFAIAHFDKGEDVLYDGLNQHNKFFGELLNDDKLMRQFLGLYIHDVYKTLRGGKQAACFVRTRPKQLLSAPGEPWIPAERIRGRAAPIRSESRTSTCTPARLPPACAPSQSRGSSSSRNRSADPETHIRPHLLCRYLQVPHQER